jgi:fermentation-respiration switch protein FrsA (DUF1100 family)
VTTLGKILLSMVTVAAAVYAGICLLVVFRQARFVYHPSKVEDVTPRDRGLAFDGVMFRTADGEALTGWYVGATTPPPDGRRVVLFCHGNAGNRTHRVGTLRAFHDMGFDVFLFDYRGYGLSTGTPTEEGTYADARAAWRYLVEKRHIPPRSIAVFGRSLGGAVAAQLATEVKPAALIVDSTFSSARDMAAHMFPYLPVRLLCRFDYNTRAAVVRASVPLLVAHSPLDEIVPFQFGRAVFDAAPEPKVFVEESGGHNDGGLESDAAYRAALKEFVLQHVAPAASGR